MKVRGAETVAHLLRHFGATTLCCSSARCRNSFRSLLRLNGTSNIGIVSRSWSHLINKCGPRAFMQVAGGATVSAALGTGGKKELCVPAHPVTFSLIPSPYWEMVAGMAIVSVLAWKMRDRHLPPHPSYFSWYRISHRRAAPQNMAPA